ncbi:MAG: ATP-binding cassette domain-containing protein [Nitrososphaeria archaeon]|nr:ATP-binding cassette domain-containing protein [Nitrososphaeria archaeon]
MTEAIRTEGIEYVYPNGFQALKGIDISINEGEFVAVMGQNGSGKTTLVKHFNGLLRPTRGKVYVFGEDSSKYTTAELCKIVGYVFQNPDHQIFSSTLLDEIGFGLRNLGYAEDEVLERVKAAIEKVDLKKSLTDNPHFMSMGERHRVAIASILVLEPKVLILDEPTTGLDYKRSLELMELVKKINEEGKTIVLVTHDVNLAAQFSKRVVILKDGKIIADGSSKKVLSDTLLLAKSNLIPPQINILAKKLKDINVPEDIIKVEEMVEFLQKYVNLTKLSK